MVTMWSHHKHCCDYDVSRWNHSCGCAGDNRQPKRYIPFAEGPRNCVGQSLAKVSLVATMALLLSRFSFKLADDVSLSPNGCISIIVRA